MIYLVCHGRGPVPKLLRPLRHRQQQRLRLTPLLRAEVT